MPHLVQLTDGKSCRVALVEEPHLRCLSGITSIFDLARAALDGNTSLTGHNGRSSWRLLPAIDVPGEPARTLVAGTGLPHLGSAKERQTMHLAKAPKEIITDSMRMFQWDVEQGLPNEAEVSIVPEWFYKGDGSIVRVPSDSVTIPPYAEDGGEEAEAAGIYLVDKDGTPHRIQEIK